MEIEFQAMTGSDLEKILHLQPDGWPDIVPEFTFYIRKEFCHPVKAVFNQTIVGIGTSISFRDTAWLAHIIVAKEYRNRGIGQRITRTLLTHEGARYAGTVLLIATELGRPVYEKAGFRAVTEYLYCKRHHPSRDLPVSPHIRSCSHSDYPVILELDKQISGEDRRSLLGDFMEDSLVYTDDGSIKGFYMPELGEGLILALTPEAGLELMKVKYARADKAVLPSDNLHGINFLKQHGFKITDTRGTRMILGQDINWQPEKVFSRIGGNYG